MTQSPTSLPKFDWVLRDKNPETSTVRANNLANELGIPNLLAHVLTARGITDKNDATSYLNPSDKQILEPGIIPGIEQAADRLIAAVKNRESVMVHGDYDVDGITGAVMLHDTLKKLGCQSRIFLPRRDFHGFGLSDVAVGKAIEGKIDLIVTVDCGISSAEAVKMARDAGIDVIVTDHHSIPEIRPSDSILVHPELNGDYPGGKLAGATVGFKLILMLLEKLGEDHLEAQQRLLPMVALATVADVVPLLKENRTLVSLGLPLIPQSEIPGLMVLWQGSQRNNETVPTARDIAFGMAPVINAAGRMGDPFPAAKLFLAPDIDKAWEFYRKLDRLNNERKRIMNTVTSRLMRLPEVAWTESEDSILALVDQNCIPGLAGLAASRITDQTGRPTLVLVPTEDSDGLLYRGSMRTSGDVDLLELMKPVNEHAEKIGGHKGALGLSVKPENLDNFLESAREIEFIHTPKALEIDFEIENSPTSPSDVTELDSTRPWGVGNPPPSFAWGPLKIENTRVVGKGQEHLQMVFQESSGSTTKGIGFFLAERLDGPESLGKEAHAAGHFILNKWQGKTSIEFQIEDLRLK